MRGVLWLIFCTVLAGISLDAQTAPGSRKPDQKKAACPERTTSTPLTFGEVITSLNLPLLKDCVVEYVRQFRTTFNLEPLVKEALQALHAPPELLDLIPKPPPPKPLPLPPPPAGPLTVVCEQPASCAIGVTDHYSDVGEDGKKVVKEDHYFGVAENGRKVVNGLPAGAADIQVYADGFEMEKRQIQLQENQPMEAPPFRLIPNVTSRRLKALELLNKVVASFGGVQGLAEMAQAPGTGTASISDENQQLPEWKMSFNGRWGSMRINFLGDLGGCQASFVGGSATSECKGKLRHSPQETQIRSVVALFATSQLPTLLAGMLTREVGLVENGDSSGVRKIETKDGSDYYLLSLDNGGDPSEVVYRSKPDASPITISYPNYLKKEALRYPREIDIKDAKGKQLAVFTVNDVPVQLGK